MIATILSLLRGIGSKTVLFLAGILTFLAILAKVKKSGADAQQAKSLRNTVKAYEVRNAVETETASLPGGAARIERMRRNGDLRD